MDESVKQALVKGTNYQGSARGSRASIRAKSRAGSVTSTASDFRRPSVMLEVPKSARSPSPVWPWEGECAVKLEVLVFILVYIYALLGRLLFMYSLHSSRSIRFHVFRTLANENDNGGKQTSWSLPALANQHPLSTVKKKAHKPLRISWISLKPCLPCLIIEWSHL